MGQPKDVLVNAIAERDGTLQLFGRAGCYEVDFPDCFFLRTKEAEKLPPEWHEHIDPPDRGFVRVHWPEPIRSGGSRLGRLRYFAENLFRPLGIQTLEADVDPVQRYLIEHPKVVLNEDWRILWYDLETEAIVDWDRPWREQILSFSWASSDGRKGHVRVGALNKEAGRELLVEFVKLADRHDILIAWNGARFDDKVIRGRIVDMGIPFDPDGYHWLDHLWLFKRYWQRSEDGAVTQSFALDSIARALLGKEKKVAVKEIAFERGFRAGEGRDIYTWIWEHAPDLLREYNDQDVELMRLIEGKTNFIRLHLSICHLCRVLPTKRSQYPMTHVDGRMLQRGFEEGYHFPSKTAAVEDDREVKRARGAFVPEARVGLFDSVAVVDFARMYPSIIRAFNMSMETLDPKGELAVPDTTPHGKATGEVIARFRASPEGHLPAALRGVLEERKKYEAMMDAAAIGSDAWYDAQRLSQALKILANVFYGVILSPMSRFHVHEIGESVTSVGRYLLVETLACVERRGHLFVLGDTDSVGFVASDEEATAIKDEMNDEVLPRLIGGCGVKSSEIRVDYEKRYSRIIVTASKRYAGRFAVYKGKPADESAPIDVRGLEIVRSDVCVSARKLQRAVIERLLDGVGADDLYAWTHVAREAFVGGASDVEDLVLRKGLTKPLKEYATLPVQAKVARQMMERGMEVWTGSKIQFLMTRNGPIIPEDLKDSAELDLTLYWNKYVYAPTMRVLEAAFPDYEWKGLDYARGQDLNQLDMFDDGSPQMKKGGKRQRRVRKVGSKPPLLLKVDSAWGRARQLKDLLEEFPGPHPVRLDVNVRDLSRIVEVTTPIHAASPDAEPQLAQGLRRLGVSWAPAGR